MDDFGHSRFFMKVTLDIVVFHEFSSFSKLWGPIAPKRREIWKNWVQIRNRHVRIDFVCKFHENRRHQASLAKPPPRGGSKIFKNFDILLFDSKSNAVGPRSIRDLYVALERFCHVHVHVKYKNASSFETAEPILDIEPIIRSVSAQAKRWYRSHRNRSTTDESRSLQKHVKMACFSYFSPT